jgi:hypothetical protein
VQHLTDRGAKEIALQIGERGERLEQREHARDEQPRPALERTGEILRRAETRANRVHVRSSRTCSSALRSRGKASRARAESLEVRRERIGLGFGRRHDEPGTILPRREQPEHQRLTRSPQTAGTNLLSLREQHAQALERGVLACADPLLEE